MSQFSMIPEGLTSKECERGIPRVPPPLPFVPVKTETSEARTMKIKIEKGIEERVVIFDGDSAEGYVTLMETFEGLICKKKLKTEWSLGKDKTESLIQDLEVHTTLKPDDDEASDPASDTEDVVEGDEEVELEAEDDDSSEDESSKKRKSP